MKYKWWNKEIPEIKTKKCKSLLHRFNTNEIEYPGLAINPYIGCHHRCVYCYATYEWYPEFYDKVYIKINSPKILKNEIKLYGENNPIMIGSSTDAYQPVEIKYRITRKIIETLEKYKGKYYIFTKSTSVLLDKDLHKRNAERCLIVWSLTTLDEDLKRKLEPFASSPEKIFQAIEILSKEKIKCGINIDPIIPGLTDNKEMLKQLIYRAKKSGAKFIIAGVLRLRKDIWNRMKEFFKSIRKSYLIEYYKDLYFKKKEKIGCYYLPSKEYREKILDYIKKECNKNNLFFGLPFKVPGIEITYSCKEKSKQLKLINF